jgi:steroid delta-isomerase-like uncharacterized protein
MEGAALQEFIDRYNAAWNDHDVDAIVSMHTDDSVFENHTTGDVNIGKDAIATAITGIFGVFPDLSFEARSQYVRDDLVVQEWTARGTHEGPMNRSGMTIEPTGRTVEYRGMDIIPIRNGLVARKDVYSDGVTLLRQLGLTEIA